MIAVEELGKGSDVCSPADHPNPVIPLLSSARLAVAARPLPLMCNLTLGATVISMSSSSSEAGFKKLFELDSRSWFD